MAYDWGMTIAQRDGVVEERLPGIREVWVPVVEEDAVLPELAGAYVLEMLVEEAVELRVGRLGLLRFETGTYRYCGSARGPGGMAARVGRHLRPEGRRDRWHIDFLTRVIPVRRVLLVPGGDEHELVAAHLAMGEWRPAFGGFGSSDCRRCPAHLLVRA